MSLGAQDYDFRIYFPVDVHTFCPDYLENPATLARLDSTVSAHGIEYVEKVTVVAFASPDGSQKKNLVLAARRAESMRSYLENKYPSLAGKIAVESGIEEWPEDNSELVRLRYAAFRLSFPFSLEIPVPGLDPDYIIDEDPIYALDLVEDALNIPFEPQPTVTVPPFTNIYFPKQKRPVTVAALKTNLLYDLATVYNLALEIPVWDRLSVVVEDTFPWWETSFKYCLQMWEIGGEVRYWFKSWDPKGADKLLGFFAGAYGMSSKFDFQWLNSVDYQGEYWSAGLTGGWSTTLGRRKWANLELSLGLGYLHTDWRHYLPTDVYDKLIRDKANTGSVDYWGPTRAQVSLVIPINVNVRRKEASHE
ncbi:MAG: DUF3575 domain-containing protein [Bacteroidales bacterium]|nr:DUF3575 domain-containing protein [Bacteroidales bacterium]